MKWIGTWPGGRIREVGNPPRQVFYLIKRLGSDVRVSIALDSKTETDAMAEFALFTRDPAAYRTRKQSAADVIRKRSGAIGLDPDTLKEFLDHATELKEKGALSVPYVERVLAPYLGAWALEVGKTPFRDLTLADLNKALKRWDTAKQKRIVALKAFTSWLRETGKLGRKDDPTLDLKVPANIPEQTMRAKGYSSKRVEELYRHIRYQVIRDMILLRAKTGMHETEIDRIARGRGELIRVSDPSGIEGVIVFAHLKKGAGHAVSVDAQTFAAVERLLERGQAASNTVCVRELQHVAITLHGCGGIPKSWTSKKTGQVNTVLLPCKECKPMLPGELRHTFATLATTKGVEVWPKNRKGVDLTKVAERMGHLSKRTTKAFYVGDHVPMMIKVPLKLVHPDDPTLPQNQKRGDK